MTWTDDRRARFQHLQDAAPHRALTDNERAELSGLLAELDREEEAALSPAAAAQGLAVERMRAKLAEARATESTLEHVAAAQRALGDEATAYLTRLRSRRLALVAEAAAALRRTAT